MKLQVGSVVAVDANELLAGGGRTLRWLHRAPAWPAGRPARVSLPLGRLAVHASWPL